MFALFALCDSKNRFVYEIEPKLFGPLLTIEELEYWSVYKQIHEAQVNGIDHTGLTYDELQEDLQKARLRRLERMRNAEASIKNLARKGKAA